ncbi:hypothetical protein HYH03_001438 [Edaphochlamys debaryana]|uniref:Cystatin domain-containing protein n=1 Tax=Edaphochlamys debaryana TaxID=47281 RepID=A0A835YCZ2_9CHLO|nr:hypothetical protein HYH03_001438 [Edaphochlamys debaryana]|eukprot:KAG2500672.1 hypothetical protein HYH03_001438 [Edaphochlamys debaryana]
MGMTVSDAQGTKITLTATVISHEWESTPYTLVSLELPPPPLSPPCMGCVEPANVTDPGVQDAAAFVVTSINDGTCGSFCNGLSNTGDVHISTLVSATKQVVSGMQYGIVMILEDTAGAQFEVNATVWAQDWASTPKQITALTFKSTSPCAGCVQNANTTDADVVSAAAFVVASINDGTCGDPCDGFPKTSNVHLVSINSATRQVVAGFKLGLFLVVADNAGSMVEVDASVIIPANPAGPKELFSLSFTPLSTPSPSPSPSACAGCVEPADVDSQGVNDAAAFVVQSLNDGSCGELCTGFPNELTLSLLEITNATQQVVVGLKYELWLRVQDTTGMKVNVDASVWVQEWTAQKNRLTNLTWEVDACPGCPIPQPTDDAAVLDAVGFVVDAINADGCGGKCSDVPREGGVRLVRVESARSQVVAGTKWYLSFVVADEAGAQTFVTAEVLKKLNNQGYRLDSIDTKPVLGPVPSPSPSACAGCVEPADVDSQGVKDAAAFVVQSLNDGSCGELCTGFPNELTLSLLEITNATQQVVAGLKYELWLRVQDTTGMKVNVDASVWVQEWTAQKNRLTNLTWEVDACPGCPIPQPTDDAAVLDAVGFVVDAINADGCGGKCSDVPREGGVRLVRVESARSQVVAGTKWYLSFVVADEAGAQTSVTADVLEKLGNQGYELDNIETKRIVTTASPPRMPCGGCVELANVSSPNVKAAAKFVLQSLRDGSCGELCSGFPNELPLHIAEIKNATSQVVAGWRIQLWMVVEDKVGVQIDVYAAVWGQDWLNGRKEITELTWSVLECPGCPIPQPNDDASVLAATSFVVDFINLDACDGDCTEVASVGGVSLVRVESARSQVVAGVMYYVTFIVVDKAKTQTRLKVVVWQRVGFHMPYRLQALSSKRINKPHVGNRPPPRKAPPPRKLLMY